MASDTCSAAIPSLSTWSGGVVDARDRWGDMVDGMTNAQYAVMGGPERDGGRRNVPRLLVQDGKVEVCTDPDGDRYASKFRKPGERGM